uniref:Uncharacterized protein n=1 Tax=Anguilla anguilla TaxID=7936 RepID=A0A0E9SZY7_ANGAN
MLTTLFPLPAGPHRERQSTGKDSD